MSKYTIKNKEQVLEKAKTNQECLKEFLPIIDKEQEHLGKHIKSVLSINDFHEITKPYTKLISRFDSVEDFYETPFNMEGQISAFNFFNSNNTEQCLDKLKKNRLMVEKIELEMSEIGAKLLRINPQDENINDYKDALAYRLEFMNNTIDYYYHYGFHMGLKWCFGLCNDFELLNIELTNDKN